MHLMGMYAAANHEIIHRKLTRALKSEVLFPDGEPPQLWYGGRPTADAM